MNELLRDHVTSTGFALTLGKTQVAALIRLDLTLAIAGSDDWRNTDPGTALNRTLDAFRRTGIPRGLGAHWVPGIDGCIRRGLVIHHPPAPYTSPEPCTHAQIWEITEAGRLVIGLFKETGLYAEYAAYLPDAAAAVNG